MCVCVCVCVYSCVAGAWVLYLFIYIYIIFEMVVNIFNCSYRIIRSIGNFRRILKRGFVHSEDKKFSYKHRETVNKNFIKRFTRAAFFCRNGSENSSSEKPNFLFKLYLLPRRKFLKFCLSYS